MAKKVNEIIRIALIGPESTAKSTLSESLASYYKTVWVPEYSRQYLSTIHRKYTLDDILLIAETQLSLEKSLIRNANSFIFIDTELIISKVWCEDVFKLCPEWIRRNLIQNKYDLYLLTYPDLPWEQDPVRENPNRRMFFYNWYESELKNIQANYEIIKGVGEIRLKNCIDVIQKKFPDRINDTIKIYR